MFEIIIKNNHLFDNFFKFYFLIQSMIFKKNGMNSFTHQTVVHLHCFQLYLHLQLHSLVEEAKIKVELEVFDQNVIHIQHQEQSLGHQNLIHIKLPGSFYYDFNASFEDSLLWKIIKNLSLTYLFCIYLFKSVFIPVFFDQNTKYSINTTDSIGLAEEFGINLINDKYLIKYCFLSYFIESLLISLTLWLFINELIGYIYFVLIQSHIFLEIFRNFY